MASARASIDGARLATTAVARLSLRVKNSNRFFPANPVKNTDKEFKTAKDSAAGEAKLAF